VRDWGRPPGTDELGVGFKPPIAALIKSQGGERIGKRPDSFQAKAVPEYKWFKDHGSVHDRSGQVSVKEMNASEPLKTCRKGINDVETGVFFRNPGQI
jgi:hypothetical protein